MPGRRPYRLMVDGVPRCPWSNPDMIRRSLTFRASSGDVLQSTYPRSGSHWLQFVTQFIVNKGNPITTYNDFTRNYRALEYTDWSDWKPDFPLRLFFTHHQLERETMNPAAKYIYMARNPWDVCVSQFHIVTDVSVAQFLDGTFEEFFEAFIEGDVGYGDYFDHVASGYALKDEPNVFFLTYEELKKDTRSTVLRLAHFLSESYGRALEEDEQALQRVLESCKPENMRKVVVFDFQGVDSEEWNGVLTTKSPISKSGYKGDKTKYAIVQGATIGSWKEYFTPELLSRLEQKILKKGDQASFMHLWSDIRAEAIARCQSPGETTSLL
ncbi:sulfotransferase 1B1-like [Amblyomma americanum]